MEKIIIKNFLIFDELEMPINKFNLLIGPQASGKSLLAKLVYFFQQIPREVSHLLYDENEYVKYYADKIIEGFDDAFGVSANNFEIKDLFISYYYSSSLYINIIFLDELTVQFSENFYQAIAITNTLCSRNESSNEDDWLMMNSARGQIFKNQFSKGLENSHYKVNDNYIFIPANRSFFSILENNAFALLANSKVTIDKFVQEFGAKLQFFKNKDTMSNQKMQVYLDKILKGEYQRIDGKDFLISINYTTPLNKASSGQQEVFPLMLAMTAILNNKVDEANSVFIEEPEAHLFPEAQNQVVSAILYAMFATDSKFFITTHSPYILSALNNSIYAKELIKKGKLTQEEYTQMSDGAYPIDFEDISAYSVQDGGITDIKDSDYMMIGGEILDSVSNEFGEVMNQLMALDDELQS